MKTEELKKIVEDNDGVFKNNVDDAEIYIYHKCENVGDINKNRVKEFNLYSCPKAIAHAIVDYANTPLEEREEEKKYYLLFPKGYRVEKVYLGRCDDISFGNFGDYLNTTILDGFYKVKFTQKEIDAMPFDTNFFIKEEVK